MRYFTLASLISALILIFTIGCSTANPSIPDKNTKTSNPETLPVWVSDSFPDGSPSEGAGLLGLFTVKLDIQNLKSEIIPLRALNTTDVLEVVDITNFLSLAPCVDCVKIFGIELDSDSNLVLKIGIRHPFPVGDPLKPITGRNRADLHVFNVEGTVLMQDTTPIQFPRLFESAGKVSLLNADGYTRYLDDAMDKIFPTVATIHPYILHFDDYSQGNFNPLNPMGFESVTIPPPNGNLVMAMGCDYDIQDYIFKSPFQSFSFTYAVGCTYGVASSAKQNRFNPEYRIPQHLKKAASEVRVRVTRNELMAGTPSSEADIEIHVVDVSHGVEVGNALNQMSAQSNVSSIKLDIPNVLSSVKNVPLTPISGTGHSPSDPLVYKATITNELGAGEGIYTGVVKVTDSYPIGANTSPLLGGKDGISRVDPVVNPLTALFAIQEFATYQVFSIEVAYENAPPQVDAVTGCLKVIAGHPFTFYVDATDPNPGQILTYHWDNGEHTPGVYDDATTTIGKVDFTYTNHGNYIVDVQVDDGVGGIASSSDPLEITVLPDGVFVDGDNAGDPQMNGSWEHPWATIQNGINNATSSGYVYVFPSASPYSPFQIGAPSRKVYGFDPDCGLARPEIYVTSSNTYMNGSNNSSIENIIFNFNYNVQLSTVELIRLNNSTNALLKNCKFTGETKGSFTYVLRLENIDNSSVEDCEFVNIKNTCPPSDTRYMFMFYCIYCDNFTFKHNELHDIEIVDLGPEVKWSGIWGCIFSQGSNISIKNNLFYNFHDHSPSVISSDQCNVLHAMQCSNVNNFFIDHNTIDNFNCNDGDTTEHAWTVGLYATVGPGTLKNNIFKSTNYYIGPLMYHWSAGFWADSITDPIPATYSCVFWGNPAPPPFPNCQVASYLNRFIQGTGSYNQNDLVDPNFNYTPGANYYHPQNPLVKNGDENGGEMGCFGGPDGNWTPPSQIYN